MNTKNQDAPSNSTTRQKPSRFRISLRSLAVVWLLIAICGGSLHQYWYLPWKEQKQAVTKINNAMEGAMGSVHYEPANELPWWKQQLSKWLGRDSVTRVAKLYADGTGKLMDISAWKGVKSVEHIGFDRAIVDDLSALRSLVNVKTVFIFQAGAKQGPGKAGLEVLGALKKLETVELHSSNFSFNNEIFDSMCDATTITKFSFYAHEENYKSYLALPPLSKLKDLEDLEIWFSLQEISPQDLHLLGKLANLKELRLYLNFRDQSLDFSFLTKLAKLEACLINGELTKEQASQIRSSVSPHCKITLE